MPTCVSPRTFLAPFFTDSTCPRQLGFRGGLVARYQSFDEVCGPGSQGLASTLRCSSNPDSRLCIGTNVRVAPYTYAHDSPAFNGSLHAECEWRSQPEYAEWISVPRLDRTRLKSDKIHPKTGRLRPSEQEKLLSSMRASSHGGACDSSTYPTMVASRIAVFDPLQNGCTAASNTHRADAHRRESKGASAQAH